MRSGRAAHRSQAGSPACRPCALQTTLLITNVSQLDSYSSCEGSTEPAQLSRVTCNRRISVRSSRSQSFTTARSNDKHFDINRRSVSKLPLLCKAREPPLFSKVPHPAPGLSPKLPFVVLDIPFNSPFELKHSFREQQFRNSVSTVNPFSKYSLYVWPECMRVKTRASRSGAWSGHPTCP